MKIGYLFILGPPTPRRVVGHSNFLAVLTAEGPSRAELLRLLVLLVSGGGVLPRGQGGEDVPPAAARPAGTALVRPLLALYGASLAEDDKVHRLCEVEERPQGYTSIRYGCEWFLCWGKRSNV